MTVQDYLDLVDWRRRVGDAYRAGSLEAWRAAREQLFREHPQSPVPPDRRGSFPGLLWFEPDPAYRVRARLDQGDGEEVEIDTGGEDGVIRYRRIGSLCFTLGGEQCGLTVLSLIGYGGGLFAPFRDTTSARETYGGGRYLFDTAKNTDAGCLEITPGSSQVTIDFNWAYHPSCYYNPRWACPLAPRENWLSVPVRAGERSSVEPAD
jgi:uncharacterized protein (DUF1684 family)